jgi:transposase
MVSPSVFRGALLNAGQREGLDIRIVPGAYSTSTCHACQTVENWDQSATVIHRCGNCGALWDQDQNAAINLLARGKGMGTGSQGDGTAILTGSNDLSPDGGLEASKSMA